MLVWQAQRVADFWQKNVHSDCGRLIEWMANEKDENGLVFAPYSEIVVDMKLPDSRAA